MGMGRDVIRGRRFAKIKRLDSGRYAVDVKDAADFRRWSYRDDFDRYPTKADAEAAAERRGLILVARWADVELTEEEQRESGYL